MLFHEIATYGRIYGTSTALSYYISRYATALNIEEEQLYKLRGVYGLNDPPELTSVSLVIYGLKTRRPASLRRRARRLHAS